MREGLARQRNAQVLHVGKIRLGPFCGGMDLFKNHLALRTMQGTPGSNLSLERAHLGWAIAVGMALTHKHKQGGSEASRDRAPVARRPRANPPQMGWLWSARCAGASTRDQQLARPFVLTSCSLTHASFGRCLRLCESFASVLHKRAFPRYPSS